MILLPLLLTAFTSQPTNGPSVELRAGIFLGTRVAKVEQKLPVRKQVVLVPDEATYLDEISKWSTQARWPVLFDQEPLVSQFVRAFKPETVWRRESVGKAIKNKEQAMELAVASAWDGDGSIENAFAALRLPPMGVVFTNANDAARTGAVALAAGRGQLLRFISDDWGPAHKILSEVSTTALQREIDSELQTAGVKYQGIGDTIDALTLCLSLPSRVTSSIALENPIAVTDAVGRDETGKRFAWTGWLFGSKAQSTYMAMCSLFLERDQYWFCNTYPNTGGWTRYGIGTIAETLPQYGIDVEVIGGSSTALQQAGAGGVDADVVYFTSKGNPDFLELSDGRVAPSWLPILNTPASLYFLHSWSLKNPETRTTVGGTWLSRGVYAYIGSSHEPMLSAFVPPTEIVRRTMSLIPFLIAGRWNPGENPYARVWRLNTIGDPLMLCPPKGAIKRTYLEAIENEAYTSLATLAKESLQETVNQPSDQAFARTISLLCSKGDDSIAQDVWNISAKQGTLGPLSARAVLPVLFRLQNTDAFLHAFSLLNTKKGIEQDMLWQLVSSRADTPLQVLIDNLRKPFELDDLLIIRTRVERLRGVNAVISIIQDKLKTAKGRNQRGLQRLLKEYND